MCSYSFRCHRAVVPAKNITEVYAVNALAFHPRYEGVLATAGSDGTMQVWDLLAKARLESYSISETRTGMATGFGGKDTTSKSTISAAAFSHDGEILAYGVSYDWSKGFGGRSDNIEKGVMVHKLVQGECQPKKMIRKQ